MRIALVVDRIGFSVPLGPAYLASSLQAGGRHEVRVFTIEGCRRHGIGPLERYRPEVVGYSVITGVHREYLGFNRALKPKFPFQAVFGGPHPTFYPGMLEQDGVDAICAGEGEDAFAEFVDRLGKGGGLPTAVANVSVKRDGVVHANPVRPLREDLDTLPFPDRGLFLRSFPSTAILERREFLAHRGCPYDCSYCFNHVYNRLYRGMGKVYRSRSPRNICDEIAEERRSSRVRFIHFVDDNFTFDVSWLREFCALYRQEVGIPFSINMRLDHCSEEVAELLRSANCHLVYVGVESGSDHFRNDVMRRRMGRRTMLRGVRILQRHGIKILTENIVGLPGETYHDALKTLAFNRLAGPDFANASLFTPYPGLDLTALAARLGYYSGEVSDIEADYYHRTSLTFDDPTERNRLVNLRCFFGLLARHRGVYPLFRALSSRRCGRATRLIGDLLDGYHLYRLLPNRPGVRALPRLVRAYLGSYR